MKKTRETSVALQKTYHHVTFHKLEMLRFLVSGKETPSSSTQIGIWLNHKSMLQQERSTFALSDLVDDATTLASPFLIQEDLNITRPNIAALNSTLLVYCSTLPTIICHPNTHPRELCIPCRDSSPWAARKEVCARAQTKPGNQR